MFSVLQKFRPSKSFLVQIASAGLLASVSDVLCQLAVEKTEKWDVKRTGRFVFTVSCIVAPIQYRWFQMLQNRIKNGTNLTIGLKRMIVDQVVAAPVLTSLLLFTVNILDGNSVHTSISRTKTSFVPVISTNYKVWPFVQVVNFAFIPLQYRVVFVQFIGVFWNIYLSHMAQLSHSAQ